MPLVVVLHGHHETPAQLEASSRFSALADSEGFVAAYPSSASWDLAWVSDDITRIDALIKSLISSENIDPGRVYVAGISAGAFMAYHVACSLSSEVAAIGSVEGVMSYPNCQPSRPVSVIAIHGTADRSVPFTGWRYTVPETIDKWRAFDGCEATSARATSGLVTTERWPCKDGTAVELDTIAGGTHVWPGDPSLPSSSPDSKLDATGALWSFFRAHPRETPGGVVSRQTTATVKVARSSVGRQITVIVHAGWAARISIRLQRGRSTLTTRSSATTGARTVVGFPVPRNTKPGGYTVRIAASDRQGSQEVVVRKIRL